MTTIRPYRPSDATEAGILIEDTFGHFNLSFAPPGQRAAYLGPFQHARSTDPAHRAHIAEMISADIVLVAEDGGQVVGILRGSRTKLQSLFVRADHHRQGIGRALVQAFEDRARALGADAIKVQATLYGVPFYQAMGYVRTTGVRSCTIFDGEGFPYQPMRKSLGPQLASHPAPAEA